MQGAWRSQARGQSYDLQFYQPPHFEKIQLIGINSLSSLDCMIEQDEEIIKKLMNMLGSGKELKFKSPNGQTIRVAFQGNSYNDTEPESSKELSEEHLEGKEEEDQEEFMPQTSQEEHGPEQNMAFFGNIQEDLKEMADDFNKLSRIKSSDFENMIDDEDEDLVPFHLPHIEQIAEIKSESSKKEDSIFKQFGFQDEVREEKPKKIHLSNKNIKKDNESVISFFKEEHSTLGIDFQNDFSELRAPLSLSSSPVITRMKQDIELVNHKSQTIKECCNKLKSLHPQSGEIVQIISSRIDELESIEKSISLIGSSISNSLSLGFESFEVSMLSFNRSISDPLCQLMANFINKAREANKNHEKSVPSSFLFMYSQPLVDMKKCEVIEQIDYFQEEQIVQKILKDGKCKVDYIHVPATVEKFHYWITKGVEIVHFCGHGVQSEENYLLFENDSGQSSNVTVSRLTELLNDQKNSLKLVFVASCHSESAGKVFAQAGASHVICIRNEYQILDEACHQFVKLFYLTCINTRTTICQAFEISKKQLLLKGRFTKHECQKFMLIRNHPKNQCSQHFQHRNQISNFNDLNPRPEFNKYMLSRVEHYIPRSKEIYEIIQLIQHKKRRYITIIGQSGLGKSTLVRQLVRYMQFRNYFLDGTVYLELARCETMSKVFEVLDLEFFQTSQLKLNKSPVENALRLSKEIGEKNILLVFDNCQAIMASDDKDSFKKLTEIIMKNCVNVVFIFTNRYSISRQIDYCSQVLFELGKLTESQSNALFFKKAPREINKKEYDDFFKLDTSIDLKQVSKHSLFQFLNGHPQAICLTASLLAERSLSELHKLLLQPNISNQLNKGLEKESSYREGINKVVTTAMKISLNVIHHKYKDCSQMIKILSLLPNGLQSEMMHKIFPQGGKWKQIVKRLINHSLVQCIEKAACRYYLVHPQIITDVESEMGMQEKIRYHERICTEFVQRINKIYKFVGTSSQYSQRAHELFLVEEDNYRAIFLRELSFIGEKYPLRKFYENLFKFEFQGLDQEQKNDFGEKKLSNIEIINMVEANKKKKNLQAEKNIQKKEPIDLLIVYYITIVFIIKKVKNLAIETYLNYGFIISLKRNKYLVIANLLRLKACTYLSQSQNDAKQFFQIAHAQFAQLGCGLGSACCEAALGYIKLSESEYAPAKKNLENALKYYQEIPHPFGKHYLNRWLCSLKSKMNKQQKQLINHKLEAQKLLKQTKQNLRSNNLNNTSFVKHKFGYFAFRFLFDNISLFLQATFQVDLRPKFINQPVLKKHNLEKNNVILEDIYNEENVNDEYGEMPLKSEIRSETKPDFPSLQKFETPTIQNSTKNGTKNKKQAYVMRYGMKEESSNMSSSMKEKELKAPIVSIKSKKSIMQKSIPIVKKQK